jgi:hypothetical protein
MELLTQTHKQSQEIMILPFNTVLLTLIWETAGSDTAENILVEGTCFFGVILTGKYNVSHLSLIFLRQ